MSKYNSIRFSLPNITYSNMQELAENIDCVSHATGNPKAATAAKKVCTAILKFYNNEKFQKCLEAEGINALAYVERCINRGMKESLGEK